MTADADGVGNRFCVLFPRAESTGLSAGCQLGVKVLTGRRQLPE